MPLSDLAIRRFDRLLATYRARTAAFLVATWDGLGSYGEDDIDRFAAAAATTLAGAKRGSVAASVALYAIALEVRPPSIQPDDVDVEPRIDHPFHATWHAVAEGRPNEEALAAGRSQAQAVAADFVQQVSRRTGDVVAKATGVKTRWRRAPNAGACPWCKAVAGQTYHSSESADFGHDRCYCMVVPAGSTEGRRVTRTVVRGEGRRATKASPVSNALDRAKDARRQLLTETDPARRRRLLERAERWERRAQEHARSQAKNIEAAAEESLANFNRMLGRIDEHVRNFRR